MATDPCGNSPGTVVVCPPEEEEDDEDEEEEEDELPPDPPLVAAAGTDGTCDLNDSRATRPAMVPVTARITRRIVADPLPQNSNDSK